MKQLGMLLVLYSLNMCHESSQTLLQEKKPFQISLQQQQI